MPQRVRHWCFTIFDDAEHYALVLTPQIIYSVWQVERSPETQRLHVQGYIELKSATLLNTVKNILGSQTAHLEPRMGTRDQARAYCMKPDTRHSDPVEIGTWRPIAQGARNDLSEVQDKISNGVSLKRISEENFGTWLKYHKSLAHYIAIHRDVQYVPRPLTAFNRPACDLTKALYIYGPSNFGKTAFALAHFETPLVVSKIDDLQNLDLHHDGIVFDDMSFTSFPPESIIHLLDMEVGRSISNRYYDAFIPAGMKRIFVHNYGPEVTLLTPNTLEQQRIAIFRRLNLFNVTSDLRIIN